MADLHLHLPEAAEPCGYLRGREATTEYRVMTNVTPYELEEMLIRGWRRFGFAYFRPVCAQCAECVSLRIPVDTFQPTKSQRRAMRKCAHLRVVAGPPIATEEKFQLHRAWHAMREETRGWQAGCDSLENYRRTFCLPDQSARELNYFDGDRLVGVGFIDETPNAISSVYFFYHPDVRDLSLGVASVLFEIAWARERGKSHVYLGYRIADCPSTAYKAQFKPHELLHDRPPMSIAPDWREEI